jgi:hypothetical protein
MLRDCPQIHATAEDTVEKSNGPHWCRSIQRFENQINTHIQRVGSKELQTTRKSMGIKILLLTVPDFCYLLLLWSVAVC